MIELHITYTGKSYSPRDSWRILNTDSYYFDEVAEAKAFLKDRYGTCKRSPIYRETAKAAPVKTGWVFGYRNADWSHSPVEKWLSQDWAEILNVTPMELN